jgi:hypothetical protein
LPGNGKISRQSNLNPPGRQLPKTHESEAQTNKEQVGQNPGRPLSGTHSILYLYLPLDLFTVDGKNKQDNVKKGEFNGASNLF